MISASGACQAPTIASPQILPLSAFFLRRGDSMTQQRKIRLLIADDHDVVRSGLKGMLAGTDIKVVGEVTDGQAAVEYVLKNEVDVVLLDVRMPDGDGLNTLGRIKLDKPSLPILMFSYVDNPPYRARAVALEPVFKLT